MKKSRYSDSQIINILKQAEAGAPVTELRREHGMSDATFYKWRSKFGGMDVSMMARMKDLEEENRRLKKMSAEESLKAEVLKEAIPSEGDETLTEFVRKDTIGIRGEVRLGKIHRSDNGGGAAVSRHPDEIACSAGYAAGQRFFKGTCGSPDRDQAFTVTGPGRLLIERRPCSQLLGGTAPVSADLHDVTAVRGMCGDIADPPSVR